MNFEANLIFDVGLHRGEDTEYYLKKGFRVIGFEADAGLIKYCRQKFATEIQNGLLHIIEGAIAPPEFGEDITFYASTLSVWGSVLQDWVSRNQHQRATAKATMVKRVDIKNAFTRFGVPFYIKIDIEGMDSHILDVVSTLPVKPKYLSIESEKVDFDKLTDEMTSLKRAGYSSFKVVQQKDIPGKNMSSLGLDGKPVQHRFEPHSSGPFGEDIYQPWIKADEALEQYRQIFKTYQRSGDAARIAAKNANIPLVLEEPGWYDTHAKLDEDVGDKPSIATVIISCKNRLEHLKLSLPKLVEQPDIDIILVDYGCNERSGHWVQQHYPSIKVIFVEDDPVFSISRARNIGALYASTEYIVFTDADILIDFMIGDWLTHNGMSNEFYTVHITDDPSLCGTAIFHRHDFLEHGKYDEIFRGWGWEDTELYLRLKSRGLKQMMISGNGISSIQHDDSLRQFSQSEGGAGSRNKAMTVGLLYTKIKQDYFNQQQAHMDAKQLQNLKEKIRQFVDDLYQSDNYVSPFSMKYDMPPNSILAVLNTTYLIRKLMQADFKNNDTAKNQEAEHIRQRPHWISNS